MQGAAIVGPGSVSLNEGGTEGGVQGWEGLDLGPMEKPWERLLDFVRRKVGASEPKAVLSSSRAGAGV